MVAMRYFLKELAVAGVAAAGTLTGCARAIDDRGGAPMPEGADSYIGQHVTIVGEVGDVRGQQTFTLAQNALAPDEPILVIGRRPVMDLAMGGASIFRGNWLQIHGTIQRLTVSDMEQQYHFTLDADLRALYDSRPVLVADWISTD